MSRTIKFAHAEALEILEFIETSARSRPARSSHRGEAIGINRADSMCATTNMSNPIFPAGLGYDAPVSSMP